MHGAVDKSIPTLRLPEFRRPPTLADLTNIVRLCEKNKDRYIIQPWSLPNCDLTFSLRVFLMGSGDEYLRLKSEGKLIHPEWTLLVGPEHAEEPVWVYTSRDMDLVFSLVTAEIEGQVRAANAQLQSVTLKDVAPTSRAAVQQAAADAEAAKASSARQTHQDLQSVSGQQPPPSLHTLQEALPPQANAAGQSAAPGMVLSGNIATTELQNVIQSISLCKMYGALIVTKQLEQAAVFFENGEVVDSIIQKGFTTESVKTDLRGDHAFLELLTWNSGEFYFDYSRKAFSATITKKVQNLVIEGLMLRDYCVALINRNIDEETKFVACDTTLSRPQVEAILQKGLPLGVPWQVDVYADFRNGCTLYELLRHKPMPKAVWAPLIYNMLTLRLIAPAKDVVSPQPQINTEFLTVDKEAAAAFAQELLRPDTGICNYSMFCYSVSKELERFKYTSRVFSILIFQPRLRRGKAPEALNAEALRECQKRLSAIMGPLDVLGHYQLSDLGLLLPESGELPNWLELFNGCRRGLTWPLLPGVINEDEFLLTISLYAPDANGNLLLRARKSFPEQ